VSRRMCSLYGHIECVLYMAILFFMAIWNVFSIWPYRMCSVSGHVVVHVRHDAHERTHCIWRHTFRLSPLLFPAALLPPPTLSFSLSLSLSLSLYMYIYIYIYIYIKSPPKLFTQIGVIVCVCVCIHLTLNPKPKSPYPRRTSTHKL
jgi:hypothetical protein